MALSMVSAGDIAWSIGSFLDSLHHSPLQEIIGFANSLKLFWAEAVYRQVVEGFRSSRYKTE